MRLVVNQTMNDSEARETATNIATVAKRFLDVDVEPLGGIPADPAVLRAVRAQGPFALLTPRAPASQAIERLAMRILGDSSFGDGEMTGSVDPNRVGASVTARSSVGSSDVPRTVMSSGVSRLALPAQRSGIGGFVQRLFGFGRGS
jgi:hypothetical protein